MRRVKNKNTKPEMLLRKALWQHGFRYRLKAKLIGRPDLVFTRQRLVVFVDGCFWHGCPRCKNIPKSNREFWQAKIDKNMARDVEVTETLRAENWRVLRIWEHDIKKDLSAVVAAVAGHLRR